jgi:hypothetical protein
MRQSVDQNNIYTLRFDHYQGFRPQQVSEVTEPDGITSFYVFKN